VSLAVLEVEVAQRPRRHQEEDNGESEHDAHNHAKELVPETEVAPAKKKRNDSEGRPTDRSWAMATC
jgi:hypothetical protein